MAAIRLFKQYLTGPANVSVESRMTLPNSVCTGRERGVQAYFEVINHLLKRYATDSNTASLDNDAQSFKTRCTVTYDLLPAAVL